MRPMMIITGLIIFVTGTVSAQILYEEHFTNGVMALDWQAGFPDSSGDPGDSMQLAFDPNNPSGDGWIGTVSNYQSGNMVGMTYAGSVNLTDYTYSAYVYTVVTSGSGGPYNSLVFRCTLDPPDSLRYYQFDADFDNDHRLRFRKWINGELSPIVIYNWLSTQIPGGVPTTSSWHQMSVRLQGNQFWFYWDGLELPNCPISDTTTPLLTNGYFGVYIFHMNVTDSTRVDDIVVSGSGTLTVNLTPYGAPIVIPFGGGSFNYNIAVTNGTSSTQTFDGWTAVTLPNGLQYGPLLGPLNLTLPASTSINRDRTQNVPGSAPAGQYVYRAYVGQYPFTITDTDSFYFTKVAIGGDAWVENWENSGEALTRTKSRILPCTIQPNPFNPTTAIRYQIPDARNVSLLIYDITGRLVARLVDGWQETGSHEVTFDGSALTSGVYLYRLQAGDLTSAGKMLLVK